MAKNSERPKGAMVLNRYAELDQYVRAFSERHLNLLIIVGRAGLQKSRMVRQCVGGNVKWIEGNATAFRIYIQLWENRDELVVIDDVDCLYSSPSGIRLLKSLCQTEEVKTLSWQTNVSTLDREGIPREFVTRSRVVIIANSWKTLNENVAALQDRGHCLLFSPSPLEIHRRVSEWFWDQEVFDFIGEWLHVVSEHSMRNYLSAHELKRAGISWKNALLKRWLSGRRRVVATLKANTSYDTEEARVREFRRQTGCCRATYFNHAKSLEKKRQIPRIVLRCRTKSISDESLFRILRDRFGERYSE